MNKKIEIKRAIKTVALGMTIAAILTATAALVNLIRGVCPVATPSGTVVVFGLLTMLCTAGIAVSLLFSEK